MSKNFYRLDISDINIEEHFEVVSELAFDSENLKLYTMGNATDNMSVIDTPFDEGFVKYVYEFDSGHEINFDIATAVGLGVVKDKDTGELFIYNSDESDSKTNESDELLRLGIYYQLTHPSYDDKKLDGLLNKTKGGETYLRLLFVVEPDEYIQKLKEIFNSKKGNENNIVEFKSPLF
jgi:hypothetical protein